MELPDWLAVMEHVPTATSVTLTTETVQTEGVVVANVTASPELAVALRPGGVAPRVIVLIGPNAIVCGVRFTVNV